MLVKVSEEEAETEEEKSENVLVHLSEEE